MALIGSITNWGEIQGQINDANGVLTGVISSAELLGGEIVGLRGLKGDKGDQGDQGEQGETGDDGYSPSASVTKVDDTTTITITDKDGTTTADVYDGKPPVVFDYDLDNPTTPSHTAIGNAIHSGKRCYVRVYRSSDVYKNEDFLPLVGFSSEYYVFFAVTSTIGSYRALTYNVGTMSPAVYTTGFLQQQLISGTNIKTINNESLLGSGNIDIQGGGGGAFIADPSTTTYADIADALSAGFVVICDYDDSSVSGNHYFLPLLYNDVSSSKFVFGGIDEDTLSYYTISVDDGDVWSDGYVDLASTDTATQLRNGLMDALDKQKLDGIASGAEVNVQSDWNEADSTADAYIKNKPTIPSKTSDLNNDSGFITDKGVYIAEYGTTTHSNLCDAIDAEKAIIVSKDGMLVPVSADYAEDYYKWWIYEKPNRDSYGYNKGESDPQYLYNEEYFYDEYYDHWNVSKVYDSTIANSYSSYANLVGSSTIHLYGITGLATFYEYTLNANDVWTATSGGGGILDMFYPVGSYYETSDVTFDPNVSWGGTWELETAGQVHVSAGTGYSVSGALTNVSDGGSATTTLTANQLPKITGSISPLAWYSNSASGAFTKGTSNPNLYAPTSGTANRIGTQYFNMSFGNNEAHNNMQPYIVVNRWHRTA